jgi:hypothetical protein
MYHIRAGEDPQWVSYCRRERLDLTDPPLPSQPDHRGRYRGLIVVLSVLAITGLIRADAPSTPPIAATTRGGHRSITQAPLAGVASSPTARPMDRRHADIASASTTPRD